MNLPETLPARLYLLSYDTGRRRMTGWHLGYVLRAAALTDLLLAGALTDDSGKARAGRRAAVADPVLDAVLGQVTGSSRRRSWQHWVGKGTRQTRLAVREQLAAGGWIRVEPRRILGVVPADRVTVRDTRVVKRLREDVSAALRVPVGQVAPRTAALVALAASGELRTVFPRARRRRHKQRIAQLSAHTGPVAEALRKVLQQIYAAAAS